MRAWFVGPEETGERLDRVLGRRLGSRREARRRLEQGRVLYEGVPTRLASRPVRAGAALAVVEEEAEPSADRPEVGGATAAPPVRGHGAEAGSFPDLTILYRDRDVLAVDKPAGLPVQATRRPEDDHLLAVVGRALRAEGSPARPALHHRLDRGTSGVVVLGLSARANRGLSRAFAERRAAKVYLARVMMGPGAPPEKEWVVEDRLLRETREGLTRVRRDPAGREARTVFRWAGPPDATGVRLVEARPETGRTHQVRVHLAESGCPVLGDVKYGGSACAASRLMLHAWRLELPHPVTGAELRLEAPIPPELSGPSRP